MIVTAKVVLVALLLALVPVTSPALAQEPPPGDTTPPPAATPPADPAAARLIEVAITPETATSLVGETSTVSVLVTESGQPQTATVRVQVEYVDGPIAPQTTTPGGQPTRAPAYVRQGPPTQESAVTPAADGTASIDLNTAVPGSYRVVACPAAQAGQRQRCDQATLTYEAPLVAVLNGGNEVAMDTGQRGGGDPDGTGIAYLAPTDDGRLCYGLLVEGIVLPAEAGHLHEGGPDANGAVVQSLAPPGQGGISLGCVPLDAPAIATTPEAYYVNVHNEAFTAGALRGQVARAA